MTARSWAGDRRRLVLGLAIWALAVAATAAEPADDGTGKSASATASPSEGNTSGEARGPRLPRWRRLLDRSVRRAQATAGESDAGRVAPGPGAPAAILRPGAPGDLAPRSLATAGGAEPTGEDSRANLGTPTAPTPLLLNPALGLEDSPVRLFGWIQNSFTGNANGRPPSGTNFGVYPNHLADQWMGNQYYLVLENPLEPQDHVNFGFRCDFLFGHDWQFTKDFGLFDNAFVPNQFSGIDLPQIYGEVHLPVLTDQGLDIRAGRFYSLTGYESPQAIARPLLSVPYQMEYTPFTYFGAVASLHVNERLNVFSGTVDGFDRWPNKPYKWGYIGGVNWTSRDQKCNVVIGGSDVYGQLPRFLPTYATFVPVGVPSPPFLAGRRNPFYNKSGRGYTVGVLTYKWTDKLTQAVEFDSVFDQIILGFGRRPLVPHSAAYYGLGNWFLYQFNEKVTGVWRSEVFWDPYGLATGNADTYHEITLGLNVRPQPWIWIRPEARYDWSQFTHPYNDGTRNSQLTLAFDVIFLF